MGRRGQVLSDNRRTPSHGWIRVTGARGNNLQGIDAKFPLGLLCLVTGVSGSGKSTLVEHTLYPALCRRKHKEFVKPSPFEEVLGDGQIDDVLLIDTGDFNLTPWSPWFEEVTSIANVEDAATGFGVTPTWHRLPTFVGGIKIDHFLVSDGFVVTRHVVGPDLGSDHRAVIVDLVTGK